MANKVSVSSSTYDWKKTAIKVAKQMLYIIIAGIACIYADNNYYIMLAPVLNGIENYVKHM